MGRLTLNVLLSFAQFEREVISERVRGKALLMALHCRVKIRSDRVDVALSGSRLTELLAGSLDPKMPYNRFGFAWRQLLRP
jgi:DNA invertase Pin-like site-specific DNA recombinase